MINNYQKKAAFAEGYLQGHLHEEFNNPYEDIELRTEFNSGFRLATERIDSLYHRFNYEEQSI